jgi:hypothetical protein
MRPGDIAKMITEDPDVNFGSGFLLEIGDDIRRHLLKTNPDLEIRAGFDRVHVTRPNTRRRTEVWFNQPPQVILKHYSRVGHRSSKEEIETVDMANPNYLDEIARFVSRMHRIRPTGLHMR